MDKRTLSAIPRPVLTEKSKEMLLLVPHISYLVTSDRQEINGIDTLIMNFFHAENGKLNPAFRTFCQPEDYITQDLTTDKVRWKTGAINHLTGYLYWHSVGGNIAVASVGERKNILGFLHEFKKKHDIRSSSRYMAQGGSVTDMELENLIDMYQDKIREWKLQKKHEKEKAEIDLQMEKFGPVPEDYERFIREKVFGDEHYIFYNSAIKSAYCTSCELDFELDRDHHLRHKKIPVWNDREKVRHNRSIVCPYCGKHIKCKSEGMSRRKLFAVQWSVLVQKHGESTQKWDDGKKSKSERSEKKEIKEKANVRKPGPPKGNKNAEGAGAPKGNKNALKHGGYSTVYWDTLSDEEREMIEGTPDTGETLLMEQIQLFTVRERRLMKAINKYTEAKGGQYVSGVMSFEEKRKFKTPEEEENYKTAVQKKVKKGERLPGERHSIQTSTGASIDLVARLERELTSIQAKKTKAIDSLIRLRIENRKLDDIGTGIRLCGG